MKPSGWQPSTPMSKIELQELKKSLISETPRGLDTPGEIFLVVASHCLEQEKSWLLAYPEFQLEEHQAAVITAAWQRLVSGEPLAYILEKQEFFGYTFQVSAEVLIPRPETELLVEKAIEWLTQHPACRRAADLGTGSGCIGIALAKRFPDLQVTATDISPEALHLARMNASAHKVQGQIRFIQADLLKGIGQDFDLVCANLPYIPTHKLAAVNSIGYEPRLALDGGERGLDLIGRLLGQLDGRLCTPSLCLLEIEETQGAQVLTLAKKLLPKDKIKLYQDLAGKDRLVGIERST